MEFRDNGTVTIGTFLRVMGPQPIITSMNGDVPLVKTTNPWIVMKRPLNLSTISTRTETEANTAAAFVSNGRDLNVMQTSIMTTTCSGLLCDK